MAKKSIGVLTAIINADATQLMKEFNRVDRQIARASASFTKPGAKLALGFLGVQNALSAVAKEVRYVVDNIENIPGVPAETVASIISMRDNLASAKNWIDRMTAGIVGFGVKAAQAVGVGAASMMGYNDTSGLSRQETPDEIASAKDPGFEEKRLAARKKLVEAQKASSLANQTEIQQIVTLRAEATRYETFAKSASLNTVQRFEAEIEAMDKMGKANAKMKTLREQLVEAEKKSGDAFGAKILAGSIQSADAKLADLNKMDGALRSRLSKLQQGDQNDPAILKSQIDLRESLTKVYERQIPLLEKQNQLAKDAGSAISSGFEDAIFSGEKFSDLLKNIALDLARLVFRNSVTQPLAAGISSFFGGLGKPAADGGFRDGSKPYLVGEEGPELFNPGRSGTIIPNHAMRGGGGGVVVHQTNNFSTGVTRQEVAGMLPRIVAASKAAVAEAVQRGGGYRKAFG